MALVVHPHFHRRRTGVTAHVETVVPALNEFVKTRVLTRGYGLDPALATISKTELIEELKRGTATIWHAHRNHEMLLGMRLRRRYPNLRLVFTRHTSSAPSFPTRLLMKKADACVVLNEDSLRHAGKATKIVYHGIDGARFPYLRDDEVVRGLVPAQDCPVIGIVGRVRPEKGHEVLVNAAMLLRESHPGIKLIFIGACDGKHQRWLRKLEKKSPGLIEWVGEQSNITSWYRGIDIMALPSFREGFSCTVLEAMASGCVVAVSNISDFHRLIDHGRNGYLFEAGNHIALSGILEGLLANPREIQKVGEAASRTIADGFTAGHEAKSLYEMYERLLAQ